MKSVKNHFSLIIALLSILFCIQIFIIVDRSIEAYKENLANNYSIVVVSKKQIKEKEMLLLDESISSVQELPPDNVIKRLNTNIDKKNMNLLKLTLPKFYKLYLYKFPTPDDIKKLKLNLSKNKSITKIEDFAKTHDTTYKLLVLFKNVVFIFAMVVSIVTMLLILKELRIWQFKHNERMSVMGLFGAPIWLRSAILFRLAIVDALISSVLIFLIFIYISTNKWVLLQFQNLNIKVEVFNLVNDSLLLLAISLIVSVTLAAMVVLGHKEEV
ncbi:MAG: cell division protein FtsX [Sulfurimonas sp.]|nr:cell division protein FtsX [Sulfurimonas sp.]